MWLMSRSLLFLLLCCLRVPFIAAKLSISADAEVEAIALKSARLQCKVETDKAIKSVAWFRLLDSSKPQPIYYFEPPRFNSSAAKYKDRVHLSEDRSSLVIGTVTLADEGNYRCRVTVARNGTIILDEIPEEETKTIRLIVHVPPSSIKLSTFTTNNNMTLTCRASGSTPPAVISWRVQRKNEVKEFHSAKMVTEYDGSLADRVGYFYMMLSAKDNGTMVYCVVTHQQTETTLLSNVTMVSPWLRHPIMRYFDWLRAEVPYATFDSSETSEDEAIPPGLVRIAVSPAQIVIANSTVIVTVTSAGSFPEPSYKWWSEDMDLGSGKITRIESIQKSQTLFCLIENSVGRVVMSVQVTVTGSESIGTDSRGDLYTGEEVISGALVGAIAFGSLVFILIVALIVYYCVVKPRKSTDNREDDFDSFLVKQKIPASDQPTGQIKHSDGHVIHNEKESLLQNHPDSSPELTKPNLSPSSTLTSGYGEDVGGSNDADGRRSSGKSSDDRKRAISQHLQDFDENASFVGGYESTFGLDLEPDPLDTVSPHVDDVTNRNSKASDSGSYDSGTSGIEGRYTLPHPENGSLEKIGEDEEQVRPTKI